MEKDKVSIIVPVYKVEAYLERCINSLVNQTYQNLEIILVDDGSPDKCGEICDVYAANDARVKVIHQENGGQSKARNAALDIVSGDYVCFVDSDDYVAENMVEKLHSLCMENQADISMIDFISFKGMIVDKSEVVEKSDADRKVKAFSNVDLIKEMHTRADEYFVVMWAKLFRKDLLDGIRFPAGRICEDLAVLYKIYDRANRAVFVNDVMYYYFRGNETSATFELNEKFYQDVYLALDEEIVYMDEKHPELSAYPRKTYMYWLLDKCRKIYYSGNRKEEISELHGRYKKMYRQGKIIVKEKFYVFFYLFPKLYLWIKS